MGEIIQGSLDLNTKLTFMKIIAQLLKHNFSQQTTKQKYEKVNNFFNSAYDWSHTDMSNAPILITSQKNIFT